MSFKDSLVGSNGKIGSMYLVLRSASEGINPVLYQTDSIKRAINAELKTIAIRPFLFLSKNRMFLVKISTHCLKKEELLFSAKVSNLVLMSENLEFLTP